MKTKELIQIEQIEAKFLPELQGWREKKEDLVEENPFLQIEDNKTYKDAKKRRTALVTGRTTIQNQDKLIASKIKQFRSNVSEASKELIAITLPHEIKQLSEIRRYEEKKAEEKAEKIRQEEERKQKIKNFIENIFNDWTEAISNLTFDEIDTFLMEDILADADTDQFEEFELYFAEKVQLLKRMLAEKSEQLNYAENQRLEDLRLKEEREKFEAEKKAAAKKQRLEDEKRRKEQELIEANNLRKEERRAKKQAAIDAENKRISEELDKKEEEIANEKQRLAKIEEDRLAKIKAEKQAKIDAESKLKQEKELKVREEKERKRIEALKPDVEKLKSIIESIGICSDIPKLKDKSAKSFIENINQKITALKGELMFGLGEIK